MVVIANDYANDVLLLKPCLKREGFFAHAKINIA